MSHTCIMSLNICRHEYKFMQIFKSERAVQIPMAVQKAKFSALEVALSLSVDYHWQKTKPLSNQQCIKCIADVILKLQDEDTSITFNCIKQTWYNTLIITLAVTDALNGGFV